MAKKKTAKNKKKPFIIDAHNHPDWHKHNLESFIANMDENMIARTWLLTWESPMDEVCLAFSKSVNGYIFNNKENGPIAFDRCLSYIERAPERFVLGYCPDPRRPEAIDKLKAAVDIYGVRVCGELKVRMMLDNFDAVRMYKVCGELNLPVTVHIDYELGSGEPSYPRPNYWYGGGIEAFERAIQKCPDTVFLGHAPGFWAHISDDGRAYNEGYPDGKIVGEGKLIKMLMKYPNLYCDISAGSGRRALQRDTAFAKDFLNEFQDRVLFARDFFDNEHYTFLQSLKLSKKVYDKIYFKNALKLVPDR
ncbi:MAG: amidohydrolase family protein [Planctomycetota bacterium]